MMRNSGIGFTLDLPYLMNFYDYLIALLFLVIALLYASIGHAGASGYLAVMGWLGVTSATMRPTALVLNAIVASLATWNFWRAGWCRWKLFWPFACTSIPAAWLGGRIALPEIYYKPLVGVVLVYASWQLAQSAKQDGVLTQPPSLIIAITTGAFLGFLSGITGVGGGIFLSPVLVLAAWATVREASGVAAPFILVNSLAGLMGQYSANLSLSPALPLWIIAVTTGGAIGSWLGSRRLPPAVVRKILMIVLISAGLKMIFA